MYRQYSIGDHTARERTGGMVKVHAIRKAVASFTLRPDSTGVALVQRIDTRVPILHTGRQEVAGAL